MHVGKVCTVSKVRARAPSLRLPSKSLGKIRVRTSLEGFGVAEGHAHPRTHGGARCSAPRTLVCLPARSHPRAQARALPAGRSQEPREGSWGELERVPQCAPGEQRPAQSPSAPWCSFRAFAAHGAPRSRSPSISIPALPPDPVSLLLPGLPPSPKRAPRRDVPVAGEGRGCGGARCAHEHLGRLSSHRV